MKTLTVYPKVYAGIYKIISEPVPLNEFPENIQETLFHMIKCALLNVKNGYISRNNIMVSQDFLDQVNDL